MNPKQLEPGSSYAQYDTDGDGKVRVVNASFSNWKKELIEKDLSAAERRALPDKDFVFPGKGEGPKGKQRGAYPIPDKKHARNALAMAAAHASPEKQAKVKAAVKKKYPDIEVSEGVMKFVKDRIGKKKTEKKAQKAMDAGAVARRKLQQKDHEKVNFLPVDEGKGYQPEIEHSKMAVSYTHLTLPTSDLV